MYPNEPGGLHGDFMRSRVPKNEEICDELTQASERASEYIAAVSSSELHVIVKFVRANLFCFSIDLRSTDTALSSSFLQIAEIQQASNR